MLRQARAGIGSNYDAAMAAANRAALGDVFGGIGSAFEQAPGMALLRSIGQPRRERDEGEVWGTPAGNRGGRVT